MAILPGDIIEKYLIPTKELLLEFDYDRYGHNLLPFGFGTCKVRAQWTPDLAQDLEAYHGIDAEAELTALLSEEIAAEIDKKIIDSFYK